MDGLFRSNQFLILTIVLDVIYLGLINSELLPVRPTPIVVGFGLFVLSPAIAYVIFRATGSENRE